MKWVKKTYYGWWLVATDGEILEKVIRLIGDGYVVASTGKQYASLEEAQTAAEAHYAASSV